MSEEEISIVLSLTALQIRMPCYRDLLKRYAGDFAPPCVAEALQGIIKGGK